MKLRPSQLSGQSWVFAFVALQGEASKLRLLVTLDLTHDLTAVEQAFERSVMTVSLVNAHSDLSRITYPVYAGRSYVQPRTAHYVGCGLLRVCS